METDKQGLFSDDSDSEQGFQINKDYAVNYEKWRQKEELQKLKDRYGEDLSSSSESEDEIPFVDKDFLKTLSLLKSKDPQIYDEKVTFFKEPMEEDKKIKEKKPKKLFLKDQERNRILQGNGELSEDEIHNEKDAHFFQNEKELQEIKKSFQTFKDADSEDENILEVRQKSSQDNDEDDCMLWLKGVKSKPTDQEMNKDLNYLHEFWNDPALDSKEQFLKDYLLNKKFDEAPDAIPSYESITDDIGTLSDDETALKMQETFEHKYNFRFEEPDEEFIKSYPRTAGDSLRQKDNKRKLKRENYQERKLQEKEQKREDIKRLKTLMRKEIEDKLIQIKETAGNENMTLDSLNIEEDFDPAEHDRKMQEMFNDQFYDVQEDDKPQFPSDEELDYEDWDNEGQPVGHTALHCEDPDFIMDADYDPKLEFQKEMLNSSKKAKTRKKSKLATAISKKKPVFDPSERSFEQYFDQYYKLDCEDFIGDLPVRYKYRKVLPNDFGLSIEEILNARDKELNRWCSIKKTSQYLTPNEEMQDVHTFKRKAQNEGSKRKILTSLFGNTSKQETERTEQSPNVAKKPKNVPKKEDCVATIVNKDDLESKNDNNPTSGLEKSNDLPGEQLNSPQISPNKNTEGQSGSKKKKKKKKKRKAADVVPEGTETVDNRPSKKMRYTKKQKTEKIDSRLQVSDARLKAYGLNPKKFKKQVIFGRKNKQ